VDDAHLASPQRRTEAAEVASAPTTTEATAVQSEFWPVKQPDRLAAIDCGFSAARGEYGF
jgi:hypothetical protein